MKPDGVVTAAVEPMELLDSDPGMEAVPPAAGEGEGADHHQAPAAPTETQGEGQGDAPTPLIETPAPAAKTDKPADPKAKTTKGSTATGKPKTGPTGATKTASSRPGTAQSRLLNGTQKPQTNGVTKKPGTGPADKKTPSTTATTAKRPTGTAGAPNTRPATKPAERKTTGPTRPAVNGAKTGTAAPLKKTPSTTTSSDAKPKPKTTAPASRPTSAAPRTGTAAAATKSDRPPVSKTTRPSTGPPGSRPTSAAPKPAPAKTATPTKPATPKTASSTASKPATPKTGSTAPSAGRTPTPASKTTPAKKDVSKPATPAAKKPAASPLTRPAPAKTTKPDTPKSGPAAKPDSTKKPAASASKVADAKPSKPKTPSKDTTTLSKTPGTKPGAAKATSPKKAVGTTTPTPVKRGPKPGAAAAASQPEPSKDEEKQDATAAIAAVGVTAAAAASATALAGFVVSEPAPSVTVSEDPLVQEDLIPAAMPMGVEEPAVKAHEADVPEVAAQLDLVHLDDHVTSASPLGTTVMSPPTSPIAAPAMPMSSVPMFGMHDKEDEPWAHSQVEEEIKVQDDFFGSSAVADTKATTLAAEPDLLSTTPAAGQFSGASPTSPFHEREEAVEKAEQEINEDVDEDEDEDRESVEFCKLPEKPPAQPAMGGFMSGASDFGMSGASDFGMSGASDFGMSGASDFGMHGASDFGMSGASDFGSSGWQGQGHGFDDKQPSSMGQEMAGGGLMDDFGMKEEKKEEPFMTSPNVKTFYRDEDEGDEEEEEEEEEEGEKIVDMDVGAEHTEKKQQQHKFGGHEDEEEDEDVEMVSEGMLSGGNVDNLNRATAPQPSAPVTTAWGLSQSANPFAADPWAQPPSSDHFGSSASPDAMAAQPETPTKSPVAAQPWLNFSAPAQADEPTLRSPEKPSAPAMDEEEEEEMEMEMGSVPELCGPVSAPQPPAGTVGMSQSSTLSGTALAAHSSSETSTPDELRDYDSSSGVESRSDKQQTPVPAGGVQQGGDVEQDLGIHLEKGDGEEEEAETLPADEVLGAGPPTAPASAPSSASTSGDEHSDTEGEMQINDPDAPVEDDCRMPAFGDSPPPPTTRNLPALTEDEEAAETHGADEDGGTPQSANSAASYGFDCTNSNAHSTAESCGKSPGIFSLENEDQLTEEAKDPSLIKELTTTSSSNANMAAAMAEDLLGGGGVGLLPQDDLDLDEHQYMLCGKMGADLLQEGHDALEGHDGRRHGGDSSPLPGDGSDGQPPYYSTICDKTDNFLAGNV